ncbi:hypothetical protein L873DRAFT_940708 [Choiromyces venosus 120613-1]|uniref:Uncharacterized protein n=1 Tax=Choiromyces venosus 120613-1 TaxID=1336337 RepID=A0A3N4K6R9_9PEZI|nr:hypothetical protein L873DRAFT_940708 [Choiromyces venosus 120613-1]
MAVVLILVRTSHATKVMASKTSTAGQQEKQATLTPTSSPRQSLFSSSDALQHLGGMQRARPYPQNWVSHNQKARDQGSPLRKTYYARRNNKK